MRILELAKVLWSVMNGAARRKSPSFAERRLYERVDTGLGRLVEGLRVERTKGWPHPEIDNWEVLVMDTPELLLLLRESVEANRNAPGSEAEFNFFLVVEQAVELFLDEARTGKSDAWRYCRMCGARLNDCLC